MVGPEAAAVTVMLKAPSALDCVPLLTLMPIFAYVPTCAVVGVPDSAPLLALNVAHVGLFWIEKVSAVPLGAFVVGWNA
jgi:hypothetical protein